MQDDLEKEVYGCIYKITNIINNKCYIGQTKNFKKRKQGHIRELNKNKHGNSLLQRSWNKYGKENFIFEIIDYCYGTYKQDILDLEYEWKIFYNVWNRECGFNIAKRDNGGDNWTNHPNQKEWGRKISIAIKGENNGMYNKHHTNESKKMMSINHNTPGFSGDNNGMYGKSNFVIWEAKYGTEEAERRWKERNRKSGEKLKGRKFTIKWRQKISEKASQRIYDKETIYKREETKRLKKENLSNFDSIKLVTRIVTVIEIKVIKYLLLYKIATIKELALIYKLSTAVIGNIKRNKTCNYIKIKEI
jgi:group I intron endonuclease